MSLVLVILLVWIVGVPLLVLTTLYLRHMVFGTRRGRGLAPRAAPRATAPDLR